MSDINASNICYQRFYQEIDLIQITCKNILHVMSSNNLKSLSYNILYFRHL